MSFSTPFLAHLNKGFAKIIRIYMAKLPGKKVVDRSAPRISVNKLGEYLVARPKRRLTIVKEQKRPQEFIITYYSQAEDAIAESILQGHPAGFLENKILTFQKKPVSTNWDATRRNICIEALDYFSAIIDEAKFDKYEKLRGSNSQSKITMSDVEISVRPEILLKDSSNKIIGAVKLIFSKNRNAEIEEVDYIGSVLHHYMKEIYNSSCKFADCYVIDIFAGTVAKAPKAYKQRMDDVLAACSEFRDTWKRAP